MAATTQITNIAHKLDLTDYAGDFIDDYDMDAVHADYVTELNDLLPDGVTLTRNGDIYAEVDVADEARETDFTELAEQINVAAIFERHDQTAHLLHNVAATTAAVENAEKIRILAVRAAKDSGRFTGDQIAEAAGISRDGVYKMLNRSDLTATFEAGFAQLRRDAEAAGKALADTLAQLKADAERSGHAIGQWIANTSK